MTVIIPSITIFPSLFCDIMDGSSLRTVIITDMAFLLLIHRVTYCFPLFFLLAMKLIQDSLVHHFFQSEMFHPEYSVSKVLLKILPWNYNALLSILQALKSRAFYYCVTEKIWEPPIYKTALQLIEDGVPICPLDIVCIEDMVLKLQSEWN